MVVVGVVFIFMCIYVDVGIFSRCIVSLGSRTLKSDSSAV